MTTPKILHSQNNHSRVGRPSKITPSSLSKFKEYISQGHSIEESAFVCGFSPASYYRFLDKNPEFREEIVDIKGVHSRFLAKQNLHRAILAGDIAVSLQVLKHTDPEWKSNNAKTAQQKQSLPMLSISPERAKIIIDSIAKKAKILEEGRYGQITRAGVSSSK